MEQGQYKFQEDLTLRFSDDGRQLLTVIGKSNDPTPRNPVELAWFNHKLAEHRLDTLRLNQEAIDQCIQQYNDGRNDTIVAIGERIDAEFTLTLSDDHMQVHLSCTPAQGGEPLGKPQMLAELSRRNIIFGINEQSIDSAIQNGAAHDILIAEGKPAEDGKDGSFEKLIQDIRDRRPRIDDQGRAFYNDIVQFVTVKAGDALIRRIPPTDGVAGQTVMGQVIPPRPGEAAMFAANLPGTRLSQNDPNILEAAVAGQPVFVENGAMVESTITVNDVDQHTGNIVFEGSVMINGNVTTGMKIEADGDVIITGMVEEASEISAGGDIIVQQGIIGRGAVVIDEQGRPGKGTARLSSKGSISARFIENAIIHAKRSVQVKELIAHSDVTAGQQVVVGGKDAKRGHIMGGTTRAESLIQAEVIGSPASVNTRIIAGVQPDTLAALQDTTQKLNAKNEERAGLETVLGKALQQQASNRKEILQKLHTSLNQLSADINQLNVLRKQQQDDVARLRQARVVVRKKVYNAVEITIANKQDKLTEETNGGTFAILDDQLTLQFA